MNDFLSNIFSDTSVGFFSYITFVIRFVLPVLAVIILVRCARSLLAEKTEDETWGFLSLPNGARLELKHWENIIGRAKASDIFIEYPTLSRSHAALIRNDKGEWKIYDLGSKGGIIVNGKEIDYEENVFSGDVISLGGVETVFISKSNDDEVAQAHSRRRPGRIIKPGTTFLLLTELQVLIGLQLCISGLPEINMAVPVCFAVLIGVMWLYYIIMRILHRTGFEIETIAFLLCTISMSVVASSAPDGLFKQLLCIIAGIILFLCVGWFLRDLDRAKKMRWPIAAAGVLFLAVNIVIAQVTYGAKNWIEIGGISLQPSEFVKICFVFAGAATLDRLFAKRNLFMFMAFSAVCVGALALMSDFGTAAIFFIAYLVIAFIRSGDFTTVFLSLGGAGLAGFLAITVKPYIASRFSTWGKAWEYVNDSGYQQTRTMAALASGGLLGVGAGNGWLKNVFAADTDMVFGMVAEELGLIIAFAAVFAIILLAVFAVKSSANARSSFYIIGACAAVSILVFQTILNVFGSLDILPFTGVTFPFVSKGGSSMIACWGLIAFIKAADTRQNASFAIKLPKAYRKSKKLYQDNEDIGDESFDVDFDENSFADDWDWKAGDGF